MADTFSKEKRSEIMGKIKSIDTKPEILVRKYLFKHGFRFRLHSKTLPGKPDIVLRKYKTVIFVNGCFWHGHKDCRKSSLPKTRVEYWDDKITRNIARDIANQKMLTDLGWNVVVIHQCELKNKDVDKTMAEVINNLV